MHKTIIITGSTRGLGLAHALYLAKKGYNLAMIDISKDACKVYGETENIYELLDRLSRNGIVAKFYECDLTNLESTKDTVKKILCDFDKIYGCVLSAGGDIVGNDLKAAGGKAKKNNYEISEMDHDSIFNRNYKTTLNLIKSVTDHFKKNQNGKIITTSSVSSNYGVLQETAYSISKAAVVQLTRSVAVELRKYGINVNCIAPGATLTGRFISSIDNRSKEDKEKIFNTDSSILNKPAKPEYISSVVSFLLSVEAKYVSGQVLRVDGGQFTSPI